MQWYFLVLLYTMNLSIVITHGPTNSSCNKEVACLYYTNCKEAHCNTQLYGVTSL